MGCSITMHIEKDKMNLIHEILGSAVTALTLIGLNTISVLY